MENNANKQFQVETSATKVDNQVNVAKSRLSVGHTHNDDMFLKLWDNQKVFFNTNEKLEATNNNNKFVLLDGPPYANGTAHMGHALNKLFKDLVVKSQWYLGHSVDYRPGWDCHGLPLELAVEKRYGKLQYNVLKTRCRQLAFRSLVKQRKSFKRLGVLGQWDKPYVTLSDNMVRSEWQTLQVLFDKQLLEYKQYPVHYCPACASSLAEAELEPKVMQKDSLYFKMLLNCEHQENHKARFALVWTTTPWTLPMNQGLAFNNNFMYELWANEQEEVLLQNSNEPDVLSYLEQHQMQKLAELKGDEVGFSQAQSPLTKNWVPVMHADFVDAGKTGFVHMACAHGPEDFELGQAHGLMPLTYVNSHGVYEFKESDNLLYEVFNGRKYTQVQSLVCELLNDLLVSYSHTNVEQQVCWRHKCGVYYNATWQVFLKLESEHYNLKEKVKELLSTSSLSEHYQQRLKHMLLGRAQWCLSRQRKWGCPMNLLVVKNTKELSPLTSVYLNFLSQGKSEEAQELLFMNPELEVFTDVLDVWFDSGNVVNEYYSRAGAQSEKFVVNLALEGKDQFRGWFQSMLWLSVAVNGTMPYENLFCHGFVLDEQRNKFSKSAGNGSLVEVYANTHGSDVLHLWTASQEPESDAVFSDKKLEEMKRYYSRMRLALRFMTSNLYDYDPSQHHDLFNQYSQTPEFDLHRYVLKEMLEVHENLSAYFKHYEFKKALEMLYQFCDKTLSNFYFDYVKNPLYLKNTKARNLVQCGLYEVLMALFDMVKVFCPFVAEEFYQDFFNSYSLDQNNVLGSVFYQQYFTEDKVLEVQSFKCLDWSEVVELRKLVQAQLEPLQKNKTLKARTEAGVAVPESLVLNQVSLHYRLSELLGVSQVTYEEHVKVDDLKTNSHYAKCPRCWNYELFSRFVSKDFMQKDYCVCEYCDKEVVEK